MLTNILFVFAATTCFNIFCICFNIFWWQVNFKYYIIILAWKPATKKIFPFKLFYTHTLISNLKITKNYVFACYLNEIVELD